MRLLLAILLGKLIAYFTRFFKIGGGSSAPGLFALRIDPKLVEKLSSRISNNIVITGTNGKTTTAKMLTHLARGTGLKVIRNHTGSNLERGIASALINGVSLSHPWGGLTWGGLNRHLGIWELDEAAFNTVAPKLSPAVTVILNVSRDQLDRYGEMDKIVSNWCKTLRKLPSDMKLLINGDDKNLSKLKSCFKGKMLKFSLPEDIKLNGINGSNFQFLGFSVNLFLPGIYHVYDTIAALTSANILKLPIIKCIESLKTFQPAFGRVEKLPFGYIFLIKNPAGATQVFETVAPNINPEDRLLLALNDNLADGTDVSWIWDAEFEKCKVQSSKSKVFVSGTRAYDMALRLKYAGIGTGVVEPELKKALREARQGLKGRLFILPTYTAMLELQSILAKSGIKKHYWKESE